MPEEAVESAVSAEPIVEESSDPWAEAEEAFASDDFAYESGEETTIQDQEISESHLEPEVPEYLRLDDLHVPQKYKGVVKERLEKAVQEVEQKFKSESEVVQTELGQQKEANQAFLSVFKDIASNPEKIAYYVDKYGEAIGLDRSSLHRPRQEEVKPAQQVNLESIFEKYAGPMMKAESGEQFYHLLKSQNIEIAQAVEQKLMGSVGQMLKLYHDQYIAPDKETLENFKKDSQERALVEHYDSSRGSWNKAFDGLKGKHPGIEKFQKDIIKACSDKKTLRVVRDELNKDPNDLAGRQELIEQVYLLIKANQPAQKQRVGGLPPSQKHINTIKNGGSDWDEIRNDPDLGWS